MPSNVIAKIKSALKRREIVILLVSVAVFAIAFWLLNIQSRAAQILEVGGRYYSLKVAATKDEQRKGLSGRASLGRDQGMLFVFAKEETQCFWMKDMKFPLDIIWLNSQRQVVHVEHDVSPDSYPKAICPKEKATYAIELNAGQAKWAGIYPGKVLNF